MANDVPEGHVRVVVVGNTRIAIGNVAGEFYAIDDVCTHDGGPLGEGMLIGCEIECPRHGAVFDIRTGQALTLPATEGVNSYPVFIDGDELFVEIG